MHELLATVALLTFVGAATGFLLAGVIHAALAAERRELRRKAANRADPGSPRRAPGP